MAARNLAKEYRKTLEAQIKLAPQQFMAEQTLQPLYQSLNLQNIDYLLNGSPDMDYTNYTWQAPVYSNTRRAERGGFGGGLFPNMEIPGLPGAPYVPGVMGSPSKGASKYIPDPLDTVDPVRGIGKIMGLFGGDEESKRKLLKPGYWKAEQVKRGAQKGLLRMFEEDVLPSQFRQATAQRTQDIEDVKNLSPAAREALRIADPASAKLLDQLNSQADSELGMGTALDPGLSRLVSQAIRSRQSGTLLSNGNAGAYDEALGMGQFGQQLRNQRREFAGNVIGQNQAFYGNPFQAILGRSNGSAALPFASQASAIGGQAGAKQTNYESSYAGDLYNTNFNAAINQAINAKNNQTALIGAGISAVGAIGGGAMKAI